jgi:hypothetical protein
MQKLVNPFTVLFDYVQIVRELDLAVQRLNSEQRLDELFRSGLVKELEQLLADSQRFRIYEYVLDNVLGTRKQASFEIDEATHSSVLNKGLSVLSDQNLLRLALDISYLWAFHIGLKKYGSPYWERSFRALYAVEGQTSKE